MRQLRILIGIAAMAALLAGCGQKSDQVAETAGDSLLAASPVEPPQGNMTPSESYQQPAQTTPTPAPSRPSTRPSRPKASPSPAPAPSNPGVNVPAGTALKIAVNAQITSETAQPGDAWEGTIAEPLIIGTAAPIPAGSTVRGVVKAVKPAEKGERAMLQLAITSINVGGKSHSVSATGEEIIAGSTRARNVGAVAGGAAAGALIGKAVGGSGKGALIGGLIGAAGTAGAVAGTKGYQVVVKEGAQMTFTTDAAVTMK